MIREFENFAKNFLDENFLNDINYSPPKSPFSAIISVR